MKNNINGSSMATGGFVTHHDRGENPVVRVPQKTTGDLAQPLPIGLAKASPSFKKVEEESTPKTKEDEKKAIAESVEKIIEEK